ncbi:MAG: methyltransferase domain-containing protein [Nitrospirota bacterium]
MVDDHIEMWKSHWNSKRDMTDPLEINGYCMNGKSIQHEIYTEAILFPVIQQLGVRPGDKVLEVGCGTGMFLSEIEKITPEVYGVDISVEMLKKYSGKARLHVCAAHEVPFSPKTMDRILMYSVAHCFESFEYFKKVIETLLYILKDEGFLFIGDIPMDIPTRNSKYLIYSKKDIMTFLEFKGFPFELRAQNEKKRLLNERYDIFVWKNIARR